MTIPHANDGSGDLYSNSNPRSCQPPGARYGENLPILLCHLLLSLGLMVQNRRALVRLVRLLISTVIKTQCTIYIQDNGLEKKITWSVEGDVIASSLPIISQNIPGNIFSVL